MPISASTPLRALLDSGIISVRCYNVCRAGGLLTFGQLAAIPFASLLDLPNCGSVTLSEIERLVTANPLSIEPKKEDQSSNTSGSNAVSVPEERCLDTLDMLYVTRSFEKALMEMPGRVRHGYEYLISSPGRLAKVIYGQLSPQQAAVGHCGKKTYEQFRIMLEKYRQDHAAFLWPAISQEAVADENSIEKTSSERLIKNIFPFLTEEESSQLAADLSQDEVVAKGHEAYVLLRYINRSLIGSHVAHRLYYGYCGVSEKPTTTLAVIAQALGVTGERVRQMLLKPLQLPADLEPLRQRLLAGCMDSAVVMTCHPVVKIVTEQCPELTPVQALGMIASLSGIFGRYQISKNSPLALIRRDYLRTFNMAQLRSAIEKLARRRSISAVTVDLSHELATAVPERTLRHIWPMILEYMEQHHGAHAVDPGHSFKVVIPANSVSLSAVVEDILRNRGSLMTLEEIFIEFRHRYPNHKFIYPNQLRPSILSNTRIRAKGKTSTYALAEWRDVFTGTILEYVSNVLKQAGRPMEIEELIVQVKREFPTTSQNSISTSMRHDPKGRFVFLSRGVVGLYGAHYEEFHNQHPCIVTDQEWLSHIEAVKQFVAERGRLPYVGANSDPEESSLAQWYRRIINGAGLRPGVKDASEALAERTWDLPQNLREQRALDRLKPIIERLKAMGSIPVSPQEPLWTDYQRLCRMACQKGERRAALLRRALAPLTLTAPKPLRRGRPPMDRNEKINLTISPHE